VKAFLEQGKVQATRANTPLPISAAAH